MITDTSSFLNFDFLPISHESPYENISTSSSRDIIEKADSESSQLLDYNISQIFLSKTSFNFNTDDNSTESNKIEEETKKENKTEEEKSKILGRKVRKTNIKIFICKLCFKVYKTKENFVLHYKNFHLHEKPYHCKYCEGTFAHRTGKIYHERKFHTKTFPYSCPYTDSKNNKNNFIVCSLKFPSKSSLVYHLKSKHNKKSSNEL